MSSQRERFDPPVERCRFRTDARITRDALLGTLRARSGWTAMRVESVLAHAALFLADHPYDASTLPEWIAAGVRVDAHAFVREPEPIGIGRERILAETDAWLAADKPAFMTTQRSRASTRLDLETALRSLTGCSSLSAVHRLDRETSGVVLLAKTREAAAALGRAFEEGRIAKRYLAVVSPPPVKTEWQVRGFIGRVADPERFRFGLRSEPAPGFRESHSRFAVIATGGDRASVVCQPLSGRTHQLRVHLAAGGAPIAGDALYGGCPGDRTLLHAAELRVTAGGEEIVLSAPIPPDLGSLAGALEDVEAHARIRWTDSGNRGGPTILGERRAPDAGERIPDAQLQ
ncbi:MAG: RluA family pseudouridine synthase [Deltaproteobacteria bacterium]|nr:RluA family pseudouridine synthase [Deltaproteobacteria bacterium]